MKKILFLFLISTVIVSCKKTEVVKSNIEYLTNGSEKTWKLKEGIVLLENNSKLNIVGSRPVCELDNILTLKSNSTYDFKEGATKCKATDPDTINSGLTWSLSADGKSLQVEKFIFLTYEVKNAVFTLTSVSDKLFSGTTKIEYNGKIYEGDVTFEAVN